MNVDSRFRSVPGCEEATIRLSFNGQEILARRGESVAAAVLGSYAGATRFTPGAGAPRAPFCMMGVCFECLMTIDGVANVQACLTEVREGMVIVPQDGPPSITKGNDNGPV